MLEPLLGSTYAEYVLLFLLARDEGYAAEMARFFGVRLCRNICVNMDLRSCFQAGRR